MPKGNKHRREERKKPLLSIKERRAKKHAKKHQREEHHVDEFHLDEKGSTDFS